MSGTIYWKYDYYRGGLGDFVQGALNAYAFCISRGLNFKIWIPEHPLRDCFQVQPQQPQTSTTLLIDTCQPTATKLLEMIYDRNPCEEIVLITNAFLTSAEEYCAAAPTFRDLLLRPSAPVLARIAELWPAGPRTYVSLHMRCGDAFMRDFDRYCAGDERCAPDAALLKVHAALAAIKQQTDLPIIFHTDNEGLRLAVQPLCHVLPTLIQHTAQHTESGSAADYYDSVAEFFIIGQAAKVYYIVPSGFTKWSCILFDTPLEAILND